MKTTYLGLELRSPVIVASSPYTASARSVERCAAAGAGAVVLKSLFEEQIVRHAAALDCAAGGAGMGDAGEYLERYLGDAYRAEWLRLVADARATGIPVIASINCFAAAGAWVDYACALVDAGASALELNIFLLPTDRHTTSDEIERVYADVVRRVAAAVPVPVSVKLPRRLTNVLALGDALEGRGARGVVLFNRFFEPDIDIERLEFVPSDPFDTPAPLRDVLRTVALFTHALPQLDVALSSGVHDGPAAVKALLCGARAVELCTAIHRDGFEAIGRIDAFVDEWAARHGFRSVEAFRGRMDYGAAGGDLLQRVQYMKYFPCDAE